MRAGSGGSFAWSGSSQRSTTRSYTAWSTSTHRPMLYGTSRPATGSGSTPRTKQRPSRMRQVSSPSRTSRARSSSESEKMSSGRRNVSSSSSNGCSRPQHSQDIIVFHLRGGGSRGFGGSCAAAFHQVPAVPVQVEEHGDPAVGLFAGPFGEAHAAFQERAVVAVEIVGLEEQEHAPARLPADRLQLFRRGSPCEEQRGALAGAGRDHHPPLARAHDGVLDQREAQRAGEERDRLVVIADEERDPGERHAVAGAGAAARISSAS